jgi:alkanesulfonate monooxygenase SsuD/methylene tetrahydromethanopterin reductase-like flavin-dependent oxidoreductase (luciferase family)
MLLVLASTEGTREAVTAKRIRFFSTEETTDMIKSFSTLYAGHVLEGEGIGFAGTPHDDRWYSNERLIQAFDIARDTAQLLEELGYDVLWMAEHHFQREGYECIPNLLILSQWLCQFTQRIKFGCAFNILPMWHPLRLAEDFAMVDILTGGRVIFGVGRGYHTREVETFGAPLLDADSNRELFEEQFEIVMKAFNEASFSHQGKYFTLPPQVPYRGYELKDITLVPRPVHLPVETWQPIVSGNPRGLDFMARHGIKGMILGTGEEYIDRWVHQYQEANARHGRQLQLGENLALGLWAYVDDSHEGAERALQPLFEEHVKFAAPLGMLRYSDEHMEAVGPGGGARHITANNQSPKVPEKRAWFAGTPEETIAYLKEVEEKYPGLEQILIGFPMGLTKSQFREQLARFAREVMPAFRPQRVGA